MIVECPACHTRYRVDDALVAGKDPLFQCSLDNCLFKRPPSLADEGPDPPQQLNEALVSERIVSERSERSVPSRQENELLLSIPEEQEEPPFVLSSADGEKPTPLSLRPFLVLLAALVLAYSTFSLYLLIHPTWTETFLVRLPLVGKVFVADQLSLREINLINPEGRYQQIKDNQQVFIISGQVVNTAPVAAHSIQVEGRIFNGNGGEVGRKVIFCGNEVSIKVVENLSTQEISILQKLVPPKHFGMPPGKATSFLIIFTDPPADIKGFSCRVVAAQYEPYASATR